MNKLIGGINLTWKRLILFSIAVAIYTAMMTLIPATESTSFRDIAIQYEWWILFGIIIITNSKSPLDSALKCFIFFMISQPLIYLIQVPFSSLGFGLFRYYKYWFIWTILTIPMGYIGYYINKKNIISLIILLPMLILLSILGIGYLKATMDIFPQHFLSCMACFGMIIFIVNNLFDKEYLKLLAFSIVIAFVITYSLIKIITINSTYETYKSLEEYGVTLHGKVYISSFTGTAMGNVEILSASDDAHSIKLNGRKKGKYTVTIIDEEGNEYDFEYHYDKEKDEVELNRQS